MLAYDGVLHLRRCGACDQPAQGQPKRGKKLCRLGRHEAPAGSSKGSRDQGLHRVRLDADLLEIFKAIGKGWQTRVNAALRRFIAEHPLGH